MASALSSLDPAPRLSVLKFGGSVLTRESDYRAAMEQGLSIASEQAPPDLLRVPLSVPEASQ